MEITVRVVHDISPAAERLLGLLLAVAGGAASSPATVEQDGAAGAGAGCEALVGAPGPSPAVTAGPPQVVPVVVPPAASVPPTAKKPKGKPRWTSPARDAVLKEHWPKGTSPDAIWALLLAAEPERTMPAVKDYVAQRAAYIGLKRPATASAFADKMAAARAAKKPAAVVADPAPPPSPDETAAAPKAAAPAGPGEAPAVSEAPPSPQPEPAASKPLPPLLPLPTNGKVYARFVDIRAWAGFYSLAYDGANIDRINKFRAAKGLLPVVQDDSAPPAALREAA